MLHGVRCLVRRVSVRSDADAQDRPLLLCHDGSAATQYAKRVAGGVLAVPRLQDLVSRLNRADEEQAEAIAAEGARVARDGMHAVSRVVPERAGTAETLATLAEEEGALIVAGSRGRSPWSSLVLGSVSHGLLNRFDRPLLIVPPAGEDEDRPIRRSGSRP